MDDELSRIIVDLDIVCPTAIESLPGLIASLESLLSPPPAGP